MSLNRQIYTINSANRLDGTCENFHYHIPIPYDSKFDKVVVLQVAIPVSFYLIQEGYNTFNILENGVMRLITIPVGNYNAKSFVSILQPLLNAGAPLNWKYSMVLPNPKIAASTGKYTYVVQDTTNTPIVNQPSIVCTNNVNEQLGFLENSTNPFVNGALVSSTVINFASETTLYLHSDIGSNGDSDVLQEIYTANSVPMSYITYQCTESDLYSKVINTTQSSKFRFNLTNEKNQTMNLNNVNMQFTLALYQTDRTNDLMQKYIKYKTIS
jgi:hypothetical protein